MIDKTGTLTWRARVEFAAQCGTELPRNELLRLAASLDQASKHVIAQAISPKPGREASTSRAPSSGRNAGEGIEGVVEGRRAIIGGIRFVLKTYEGAPSFIPRSRPPGANRRSRWRSTARLAGKIILADAIQPEPERCSFEGAGNRAHRSRDG